MLSYIESSRVTGYAIILGGAYGGGESYQLLASSIHQNFDINSALVVPLQPVTPLVTPLPCSTLGSRTATHM